MILVSKCVGIRQGSWETKETEGAALSPTGRWGGDTKAQVTTEVEHKNIHSTHTHAHRPNPSAHSPPVSHSTHTHTHRPNPSAHSPPVSHSTHTHTHTDLIQAHTLLQCLLSKNNKTERKNKTCQNQTSSNPFSSLQLLP